MDIDITRADGVEKIEVSRPPSTVALVVTIMGGLLVVQILIVLVTQPLDPILLGLLVLAAASSAWMALIGLESLVPTTVSMERESLTVAKLLSSSTFQWGDVGGIRLVPSGGMLSDDTRSETAGRLAVGVFLKSRKTPRASDLDADYLICGGGENAINAMTKLIEHIDSFKSTVGSGLPERGARIRKAAPITAPSNFRRPRQAS